MPRYEFICSKCDRKKEVSRKVNERDESLKCDCGSTMIRVQAVNAPPKVQGGTPKFHR